MSPDVATTRSASGATFRGGRIGVRPPRADIERARSFRPDADRARAEAKLAVSEGRMSVNDVIAAARRPGGEPLLKLSLMDLLAEQVGPAAAGRTLSVLAARLGSGTDPRDMTITWLIDPRARARRYHIWESVHASRLAPETSFPYTRLVSER